MHTESQPQSLTRFLKRFGFNFNPFQYLEATEDPHVGDYLVGLDSFSVAWDPCPALVFAPTGGGKTAMRVYTIQSSWLGLGGFHAFPVSCLLRPGAGMSFDPDEEEIHHLLVSSAVTDLFLGIAHRPQRFFELGATDAAILVSLWRRTMQRRFDRVLSQLEATGDPTRLVPVLDPAYRIRGKPGADRVAELCRSIRHHDRGRVLHRTSPIRMWTQLLELVQGPLQFSSVFLLFDGLDALPETYTEPVKGLCWFRRFWRRAPEWAANQVYVKGFLPSELLEAWRDIAPQELQGQRIGALEWTVGLLADMLRRRVLVATDGKAGSLDAFSSPDLRDVETELAQLSPPVPREALVLTERVLDAWRQRSQRLASSGHDVASVRLDRQDVEQGHHTYLRDRPSHTLRKVI